MAKKNQSPEQEQEDIEVSAEQGQEIEEQLKEANVPITGKKDVGKKLSEAEKAKLSRELDKYMKAPNDKGDRLFRKGLSVADRQEAKKLCDVLGVNIG